MPGLEAISAASLRTALDRHIPPRDTHRLGVCLVVDADRTLCVEDTGRVVGEAFGLNQPIREVFEQLSYADAAFKKVSRLWSGVQVGAYVSELERVADRVRLRSCWKQIFDTLGDQVPILVVTAGIPQLWRRLLANEGYPLLPVLGGCHQRLDSYSISARSKQAVVTSLKAGGWKVIAAGDSCIDLPMLMAADLALFVPDQKGSPALRSKISALPTVRHLLVDDQRFAGLTTCTAAQVAALILQGGICNAD